MILRSEGFEVLTAQDGGSTVSALHEGKPDLILMDIFFPPDVEHGGSLAWDGFKIMKWLRAMGGIGKTPVILLTAADEPEYADRAREAGAAGLLQKTVETAELLALIRRILALPAVAPNRVVADK